MTTRVSMVASTVLLWAAVNADAQELTARAQHSWLVTRASDQFPASVAGEVPREPTAETFPTSVQPWWLAERRACEGCPTRSVGKALFQTTVINGVYGLANLARGQVTARITPKTWWANMEQGWVWDLDDFAVNQVGHPYQGSNYFNTGRANGLSFWESAAVTAFGSATWEYYGETNFASLNDLINTTLGGIALGEMFHRSAWLIRDPRATGRGRLWREIGATVIDPITGINRFLTGDASRTTDKPADLVPSSLTAVSSAGVLWRGTQSSAFSAAGQPFVEVNGLYGDVTAGRSRTPYDAFGARLRFGGGAGLSEARVRGRLLGQPFRNDTVQFNVLQTYDYQNNDAYQTGSQSFEAALAISHSFSSRVRLQVMGWGGLTVLGAVNSLPLGVTERPEEEEGDTGQGVSEGPRFYDYGPGANLGATATVSRDRFPLVTLAYEGRHLYSIDGVRANHFLQRGRIDLLLPLTGPVGIGASAEYFDRRTFFQDADRTESGYRYPQLRAYVTWNPAAAVAPAGSLTQAAAPKPGSDAPPSSGASNLWITGGGTFSTLRGDCQECDEETPYRHSGGLLANLGYRVNRRMDAGAEVLWMAVDTADGRIRSTHVDAVAQFRPWASQGFFLKGGAGMAFIRNWVDAIGSGAINSKALSVVIGAGWAFRPEERIGFQVFGTQHAAALGDLQTAAGSVPDVMGNFWSLGAGIVIR